MSLSWWLLRQHAAKWAVVLALLSAALHAYGHPGAKLAALPWAELCSGQTGEPPRVMVLPADVEVFEVQMGGHERLHAAWTQEAAKQLAAAAATMITRHGCQAVVVEPTQTSPELRLALATHQRVAASMLVHAVGQGSPLLGKQGRLQTWSLGPAFTVSSRPDSPRFGLVLGLRGRYWSPARVASTLATVLLGVPPALPPAQPAHLSLLDLHSGAILAFLHHPSTLADVRSHVGAMALLEELTAPSGER